MQPFDDRKCDHCGESFKEGQLFLGICNECLNSGHAGSGICPLSRCPRNLAYGKEETDPKWNLDIEGMSFDQIKKEAIRLVLTNFHGNARAASRHLKIAHATIYRNLKDWERSGRIIEGRGLIK